jgi:hypothetical protein
MAKAEEYAVWLVANKDKRDTSDWAKVAAAYEVAKRIERDEEYQRQNEAQVAEGVARMDEGPSLIDKAVGVGAAVKEVFSGEKRATDDTRRLGDWVGMPEMNQLSVASAKSGIGTMFSSPEETVKVIRSNYPNVAVRQDAKGNYIMRSGIDGKEYAIKPGFQWSDVPRAIGGALATVPAGRALAGAGTGAGVKAMLGKVAEASITAAATQGAIETSQAATGGQFDPGDVAMAATIAGAIPVVGKTVKEVIRVAPAAAKATGGAIRRGASKVGEVASIKPKPDEVDAALDAATGTASQRAAGTAAEATEGTPKTAGGSVGAASADLTEMRLKTAQGLEVPVPIMADTATQSPELITFVKRMIKTPEGQAIRDGKEAEHRALFGNLDHHLEATGSEAGTTIEGMRNLIDVLGEGYKNAIERVNMAYNAARKSPESRNPVDLTAQVTLPARRAGEEPITASVIDFLNTQSRGNLDSAKVPNELRNLFENRFVNTVDENGRPTQKRAPIAVLDEDGNLKLVRTPTVAEVHEVRRDINAVSTMTPTDKRTVAVAKKLLDEALAPVEGTAYKKANRMRAETAQQYENKAIVSNMLTKKAGTDDMRLTADDAFRSLVLGSRVDDLKHVFSVAKSMGDSGSKIKQELKAATFRHLLEKASKRESTAAEGTVFNWVKFQDAVQALDKNGKLDLIMGKRDAQAVRDIVSVARWSDQAPRTALVNTSGSAMELRNLILSGLGESAASGLMFGLPVPAVSIIRGMKMQSADKAMKAKIDRIVNFADNQASQQGAKP